MPAAYLDGAERLGVEDAAHVAEGVVGHQHAAQGRGLLQPVGQVDRIAHGRVLACQAHLAQQHRAGVDADAQLQGQFIGQAATALHGGVEGADLLLHGQRGADGALRVVLAGRFDAP